MWIILSLFALVAGLLALSAAAALLWLRQNLGWAELDDDHHDLPEPARRSWLGWVGLRGKGGPRLLTYRRDRQGRFRKHRR